MADNKIQVLLEVDDRGTASLQKFGREVQAVGNTGRTSFGQVQQASAATATSLTTLGTAARAMGTALAAVGVAQFAKSAFDTAISLDSMNRALTAVYGSTTSASAEMEFLRATAARTGQDVYALVGSYTQLSASTKGTALEGENTRKVFASISEAAAVLGLSNETTGRAFTALSQMASKGTISMEELRGQLGEALPGALNLFAKGMGVSTGELIELISQGKVGAAELTKFADAVHEAYGAAAETAALESGQAAVNRLSQAWTEFKANVVDVSAIVSAINFVAGALQGLSTALNRAKQQAADEAAAMGREVDTLRLEMFANRVTWLQGEIAKINRTPIELQTPMQTRYLEELNAELGQTKKGLDIIGGSKAATKELFDEYNTGYQNVQTVNGAFGETPPLLDSVSESAIGVAEAYGKQDAALGSLAPRVNDAIFAGEKLSLAELDLSRSTDEGTKSAKEAAKAAKAAAKEKSEAARAAAKVASEAAKAEREAIAQVVVAMRNYAAAAEPGTRATKKWAEGAVDAAKSMATLNEQYEAAGLSAYDALLVELNREFAEGKAAISAYDTAMAEANTKVATAGKEYAAAQAKLAEYERQIKATSLSGEEMQAKLSAATGVVEKKRAALDAAKTAARKLEAANGGVVATEEELRKRVFETNKSLEEQRQAYIDVATKGDDFFAGMAAGALDMQDSIMTLGRVGYEVFNELREGWRDSFFAVMSGDLDDLGDIWDSTMKAMLRAFTDFLADLVMAWAAAGIAKMFGFNLTGVGMNSIGGAIGNALGGSGTAALSQYGPYAAGYQFGPGAGTSAAVTGGQAAGAALGAAGGAYGLYSAASQASKGEAGVGTALQAGISAYALYKAYPTIAAYLSGLGGASTASTAASGITIAATDLTLIGPQTGGIGNAIAGGSGTTAASGGAGAGLSTGAMVGGGAIMGIGALIAMGMGNKAQQEFYSPRYGNVPFNDYGHDDRADMLRAGSAGYNWVSSAQPGSMSGSGDAGITQTVADLEAAFTQFEQNTRVVLDVLAAAGDGVAALGQQLEDGTLSTDAFIDSLAGYDVSVQETASLTSLASQAARGNGTAMDSLRAALQAMGLGADQAEVAALALVSATSTQTAALASATSAATTASGAVSGMISTINDLSNTPLNIRVNIGVQERPYRIDNSNPYAEHAVGGIFAGPTLIPSIRGTRHLVGEAGAEAIMPLHAGPKTLQQMDAKLDALLSGGRPVQHVIQLDGRTIATATLPYVDAHVASKAGRNALAKRTVY